MYLSLDHITKVFPSRGHVGEVVAVHDVNLEIRKGELVTLLGPSGCGKTTTLRMIAGFEFPSAGRIILDGLEINSLPPHKRDMSMKDRAQGILKARIPPTRRWSGCFSGWTRRMPAKIRKIARKEGGG